MKAAPWVVIATLVSVVLSGCIASETVDEPTDTIEETLPVPALPLLTEASGTIDKSFATPVISFNYGGAYSFPLAPKANTTGYVLELAWDSTSPTTDELDLWIRDAAAGAIPPAAPEDAVPVPPAAQATGTSPLRLAVSADQLDQIEYSILVRAPGPAGVSSDQPFTLKIATFEDLAFDPEFRFDAPVGNETA